MLKVSILQSQRIKTDWLVRQACQAQCIIAVITVAGYVDSVRRPPDCLIGCCFFKGVDSVEIRTTHALMVSTEIIISLVYLKIFLNYNVSVVLQIVTDNMILIDIAKIRPLVLQLVLWVLFPDGIIQLFIVEVSLGIHTSILIL